MDAKAATLTPTAGRGKRASPPERRNHAPLTTGSTFLPLLARPPIPGPPERAGPITGRTNRTHRRSGRQPRGRLNLADPQEDDMRTYDFSPLYRSAVGFDRLANLLESAARTSQENGWPPYNIETTGENAYRIEIAVAGFKPDELNIEVKENLLTVTGRKTANDEATTERTYLHRGLAERDFERRFQLADYVVVKSADLVNGLLSIDLARELPEALKPRRIEIGTSQGLIEGKAAKAA
jgi:molecular chaperone IbpA